MTMTQNDKKSNVVEFPLKNGTSFRTEEIQQTVYENTPEAYRSPKNNALDLEQGNLIWKEKRPFRVLDSPN